MNVIRSFVVAVVVAAVVSCTASAFAAGAAEKVSFTTDDGFRLVGDYYEAGPDAPVAILLHQLGSDRSEFLSLALLLQRNGISVLAYDARGHGESTRKEGAEVSWKDFDEYTFADMGMDIVSAVGFLADRTGSRVFRLGLVGSSIQSSTALVYASRHDDVHALVMLSPGLDYRGIDTTGPMSSYSGRPVLMVASEGDEYSYDSMSELKAAAGDDALAIEEGGDAHGVRMMDSDPSLILKIEDWLERRLKK